MRQQTSEQLARLWTESQPVVAAFILSAVPDFHQAEDVLQQVAVVLVREFDKFDTSRPFLPWALGIARNVALKSRRETARHSKYLLSDALLDRIQTAFHESEDSLIAIRKSLRNCLNKQPEKVLELLQWRYAHDLKPREAAVRMGITSGAVRAMLHRAREALRKCIRRDSQGAVEWI
jgi:RNA polymerase sigma-70 factor (ECF subfamily)